MPIFPINRYLEDAQKTILGLHTYSWQHIYSQTSIYTSPPNNDAYDTYHSTPTAISETDHVIQSFIASVYVNGEQDISFFRTINFSQIDDKGHNNNYFEYNTGQTSHGKSAWTTYQTYQDSTTEIVRSETFSKGTIFDYSMYTTTASLAAAVISTTSTASLEDTAFYTGLSSVSDDCGVYKTTSLIISTSTLSASHMIQTDHTTTSTQIALSRTSYTTIYANQIWVQDYVFIPYDPNTQFVYFLTQTDIIVGKPHASRYLKISEKFTISGDSYTTSIYSGYDVKDISDTTYQTLTISHKNLTWNVETYIKDTTLQNIPTVHQYYFGNDSVPIKSDGFFYQLLSFSTTQLYSDTKNPNSTYETIWTHGMNTITINSDLDTTIMSTFFIPFSTNQIPYKQNELQSISPRFLYTTSIGVGITQTFGKTSILENVSHVSASYSTTTSYQTTNYTNGRTDIFIGNGGETIIKYKYPEEINNFGYAAELFAIDVPIGLAAPNFLSINQSLYQEIRGTVNLLSSSLFPGLNSLTFLAFLSPSFLMDNDLSVFITKNEPFNEMQAGYTSTESFTDNIIDTDGQIVGVTTISNTYYQFFSSLTAEFNLPTIVTNVNNTTSITTTNITDDHFTINATGFYHTTTTRRQSDSQILTCSITDEVQIQILASLASPVDTKSLAGIVIDYRNTQHPYTINLKAGKPFIWTQYDMSNNSNTHSYYDSIKSSQIILSSREILVFNSNLINLYNLSYRHVPYYLNPFIYQTGGNIIGPLN